jgi:hypothetical protein
MANQPKAPQQGKNKAAQLHEKPISLYPLTLEEAVDKLLQASPAPRRRRKKRE